MKRKNPLPSTDSLPEIVIPREKAVFWMDARGRWNNRHGRFEHKRIIDHFNRSIRRDGDGYYVTQERNGIREKVYFSYSGTPLFVVRVTLGDPVMLTLNTGSILPLDPDRLFTHADQLYQRRGDECIRFTARALLTLAPCLEETRQGLALRLNDRVFPISEQPHIA